MLILTLIIVCNYNTMYVVYRSIAQKDSFAFPAVLLTMKYVHVQNLIFMFDVAHIYASFNDTFVMLQICMAG